MLFCFSNTIDLRVRSLDWRCEHHPQNCRVQRRPSLRTGLLCPPLPNQGSNLALLLLSSATFSLRLKLPAIPLGKYASLLSMTQGWNTFRFSNVKLLCSTPPQHSECHLSQSNPLAQRLMRQLSDGQASVGMPGEPHGIGCSGKCT